MRRIWLLTKDIPWQLASDNLEFSQNHKNVCCMTEARDKLNEIERVKIWRKKRDFENCKIESMRIFPFVSLRNHNIANVLDGVHFGLRNWKLWYMSNTTT